MAETKIQWCDFTFNPWSGCSKVHAGCTNCYAEVNYSVKMRGVKWGPHGNRVRASDAMWRQPLKWSRQAEKEGVRLKVFCASLADVFEDWQRPIVDNKGRPLVCILHEGRRYFRPQINEHEPVAMMDDLRRDLFALIEQTPNLDWLLLTKRPENIREMWPTLGYPDVPGTLGRRLRFENVWLGASPCNQDTFDACVPDLLQTRDLCRFLFLSLEPLLGPIRLPAKKIVDLVIVGGESGPGARPCDVAWIRSIVEQCRAAGVACFVKQLGSNPYNDHSPEPAATIARKHGIGPLVAEFIGLKDKKGGDPAEWPEDLRVREFPKEFGEVLEG